MIPPPAGSGATAQTASVVSLLKSEHDGSYDVGCTTELSRRLGEHNRGESYYSRRKGPWQLVGFERFLTSGEAKIRERVLKRSPRMLQLFKKRVLNRAAVGHPRQVVG